METISVTRGQISLMLHGSWRGPGESVADHVGVYPQGDRRQRR
jgi:hypothetical protein